tara:strand:+ start:1729 stop:1905 length:177 start_codon:yes stop_codon:yes gene_type:complete
VIRGKYLGLIFRVRAKTIAATKNEVLAAVRNWEAVAKDIGISRSEQQLMVFTLATISK